MAADIVDEFGTRIQYKNDSPDVSWLAKSVQYAPPPQEDWAFAWFGLASYGQSNLIHQPQDCDLLVELTFMEDVGQWLAVDRLVGEYGEGKNCAEAVQDLVVSLFESRDGLQVRWDRLSADFRNKLARLNRSLRDEML